MIERTLCLIKPGTARDEKTKKAIIQELIDSGCKIKLMKKFEFRKSTALKFYKEHRDKDFFDNLIEYTCSDYQVAIILEGLGIINKLRELSGNTDPFKASKTTIRGKYGKGIPNNAIHSSDSKESAEREINLVFPELRKRKK